MNNTSIPTSHRFAPTIAGRVLGLLIQAEIGRKKGVPSLQRPITLQIIATALGSELTYVHKVIKKLMAEGKLVRVAMRQGRGGGSYYEVPAPDRAAPATTLQTLEPVTDTVGVSATGEVLR